MTGVDPNNFENFRESLKTPKNQSQDARALLLGRKANAEDNNPRSPDKPEGVSKNNSSGSQSQKRIKVQASAKVFSDTQSSDEEILK